MAYYLRVNFASLGVTDQEPLPSPNPWGLYARCTDEDKDSCDLFLQIADLPLKDRKAALGALHKLVQVAASGQPITDFYDKKQCHCIHTFNYLNKERIIWRIWKGGVVRVTFYYGEGRTILLTHAFAKLEDKLTSQQKKMLEKEVKAYIDSVEDKKIQTFEA